MRTTVKNTSRHESGYTMLEMLVVMAAGLVLLAITMGVFTQGLKSALFATDRAEMQQNVRAALNAITHDLSMAGSQMPHTGIQLASGAKYGCNKNGCGVYNFPTVSGRPVVYGVMPDPSPTGKLNHVISMAYPDTNLATCNIQDSTPSGSQIMLGVCMTTGVPTGYYRFDDPGYGLKEGDIMLLSAPALSETVIGVVTNVTSGGKVVFASSDKLNINQPSASHGNIASVLSDAKAAAVTVTASRLLLVTYYMQQLNGFDGKAGTADDSYRLMRQINAQSPVPIAESLASLKFSYDLYDDAVSSLTVSSETANGRPDLIRKVNIGIEAKSIARKPLVKTQYLRLATSVEPRNLVYRDLYQIQ